MAEGDDAATLVEGTVPVVSMFNCYIGYVGIDLGFYISFTHVVTLRPAEYATV